MRIHWFAFTVFSTQEHGRDLWKRHLQDALGFLTDTERKGRGFDSIDVALNEAKFYYNPIQPKKQDLDGPELPQVEYYHVEIPGSACDCLLPTVFRDIFADLAASGLRFQVKRIDIAFDDVPFSPVEFCKAVINGYAVTLAKRETLSLVQSPFQVKENGTFGSDTCYLGSKTSGRFLRIYNQRGFTRLEFVCKDERAQVVCADIFEHMYGDWDYLAREHLVQYIRFTEEFSQWHDFIKTAQSADIKISSARLVSLSRMEGWFERQVAVSLSVFYEVWGPKVADTKLKKMVTKGASRDRSRYRSVLQLANAGGRL